MKEKLPFLKIFCNSVVEVTDHVNFPATAFIYQNICKKATQM